MCRHLASGSKSATAKPGPKPTPRCRPTQVRHSVVSPHGIVSYGPTEQGLAKIISDGGNPRKFTARDIVTRAAIRRADFNIARTIQMLQNPTIGDVIASLCAQASNENYVMAFTPF